MSDGCQDDAARPKLSLLLLTFSLHVEVISGVVINTVVAPFFIIVILKCIRILIVSYFDVFAVEPRPVMRTGHGDGCLPDGYSSCKQRPS